MEKSKHLADAVEARRRALGMSVGDLIERTGLSTQALLNVRRGEVRQYQERLTIPLTRVLRWSPDSIDRLLAGDDPIEVQTPTHTWDGRTPDELADLIDALRATVSKSQSRDDKLSQIIKLCQTLTANQAQMEREVAWNSERLDRLLEHLGIEVAPLSSVPE